MCQFASFWFNVDDLSVKAWNLLSHSATAMHRMIVENARSRWREGHYLLEPEGPWCGVLSGDPHKPAWYDAQFKAFWPTFADFLTYVFEHGADPNEYDTQGREVTPLYYCAHAGRLDLVKLLLEHGANPNTLVIHDHDFRPLIRAAMSGYVDMVKVLIAHGADVNGRDNWGGTALHCVAGQGNMEIARLLLEHGADTGIADVRRQTPEERARELKQPAMAALLSSARQLKRGSQS